jgi:hypothetical protein
MPKLTCPCRYVHNLSPIPDEGWLTFRDVDYEKVVDAEIVTNSISGKGSLRGKRPSACGRARPGHGRYCERYGETL